ncbi:MAG: carboxymuconolactone decarboxylase family protein [Candidatus Eremiobacteraeota bacterium]|nr:carboxymuconolactone decarboxylase family protein [Candidatus Eremiobacteraeota bacterium]
MQSGHVARRLKELCALMVATLNDCENCITAHDALARRHGVDARAIDELTDYVRSEKFSAAEKAALAAAISLTREPRGLPQTIRDSLQAHFDTEQITEIISTIALFNYFTRVNNALRAEPPPVRP